MKKLGRSKINLSKNQEKVLFSLREEKTSVLLGHLQKTEACWEWEGLYWTVFTALFCQGLSS